jgi:hypothetical protein
LIVHKDAMDAAVIYESICYTVCLTLLLLYNSIWLVVVVVVGCYIKWNSIKEVNKKVGRRRVKSERSEWGFSSCSALLRHTSRYSTTNSIPCFLSQKRIQSLKLWKPEIFTFGRITTLLYEKLYLICSRFTLYRINTFRHHHKPKNL